MAFNDNNGSLLQRHNIPYWLLSENLEQTILQKRTCIKSIETAGEQNSRYKENHSYTLQFSAWNSLTIIIQKDFQCLKSQKLIRSSPAYWQGVKDGEQHGDTQVMISTVKSVRAMQNHMKDNCDLIYGAPSLPWGKQNPQLSYNRPQRST